MIDFKQRTIQKIAGCAVIVSVIVLLFLLFAQQNRERIFRQNENYVQDSTTQTAARIDDVLLQSLDNIEMMAYWFGKSLESPEVTVEDLQELTETENIFWKEWPARPECPLRISRVLLRNCWLISIHRFAIKGKS